MMLHMEGELPVLDDFPCCLQGVQAVWKGWQHAEGPLQKGQQGKFQEPPIGRLYRLAFNRIMQRESAATA